ncbi:MAG: cell division protein FtsQ/DivIB [Cyclobacteriaceae bacterium]
MKITTTIWNKVKQLLALLIVGGLVSFADTEQSQVICEKISINIENGDEYKFVDQQHIKDLITKRGRKSIKGNPVSSLDIKRMEKALKKDQFIKTAQVFKMLDGTLNIQLTQRSPIARVMKNNKSFYLGENQDIFHTTRRFTARVPIVSIDGRSSILRNNSITTEKDKEFYEFIQYVNNDPFFSKQFAYYDINRYDELTIYPQVTKQKIIFGNTDNYLTKLKKIKIFYSKVLLTKGWNTYSKVDVKYRDQIICE